MYNYSARRKQGLGSLRPGYFLGGTIGNLLLGNAVNWGLSKGIDRFTKSKEQREDEAWKKAMKRMGITPYFPDDNDGDETNTTSKTTGLKNFGGGLMNLLASALFGPLVGPLMLTAGRGLMNKRNQMNLTSDNIITPDKIKTGAGDPNQIQGPTTSQGQVIDSSDLVSITDDSGQDTGFSEYSSPEVAASYEGSFRKGGRVSYSKGGLASLWQR